MCGDGAAAVRSDGGRECSNRAVSVVLAVVLAVMALIASACGGEDGTERSSGQPAEAAVGLADCPNPLVIQTDWFPEPEHGAVYNLTGGQGSINPETGVFRGALAADPTVTLEVRAGGPYIGRQSTIELLNDDDEIFLGFINTDEAIANYERIPTTAVVAPLDINPQIIMWDPESLDIQRWQDVKKTGAAVSHFAGATYVEYLEETGLVTADQLDDGYDGTPDRFIAAQGSLIQQGFATQEPFVYQHVLEGWGEPVEYLMIHDSGYELYQGTLSILDSKLDVRARSCLSALVPLVQRSIVDFQRDPEMTNQVILKAVEDLDSFWQLTDEGATETVYMMGFLGIVGNGSNRTVGDFDLERVDGVIAVTAEQVESANVPFGLTAEDIVTNAFINESIGL